MTESDLGPPRFLAYVCDLAVGHGIINADGEMWKCQRKAALPFFSIANLKAFVDRVLPPYLKDIEQRIEYAAIHAHPIDMQDVFLELTTRLMGEMAYDVRVNSNGIALRLAIPTTLPR